MTDSYSDRLYEAEIKCLKDRIRIFEAKQEIYEKAIKKLEDENAQLRGGSSGTHVRTPGTLYEKS